MRNCGTTIFLIIVRRQPIIFRANESLEERPGFARYFAQKNGLLSR